MVQRYCRYRFSRCGRVGFWKNVTPWLTHKYLIILSLLLLIVSYDINARVYLWLRYVYLLLFSFYFCVHYALLDTYYALLKRRHTPLYYGSGPLSSPSGNLLDQCSTLLTLPTNYYLYTLCFGSFLRTILALWPLSLLFAICYDLPVFVLRSVALILNCTLRAHKYI